MNGQQQKIRERIAIGSRRIVNILRKHGIATMRMLEQKISDAGPNPQRVDPHLLTRSKVELLQRGILGIRMQGRTPWHFLSAADPATVEPRFFELAELHALTEVRGFTDRMGDTAEIAVMKAMQQTNTQFVGHFTDLDVHGDDRRYLKHDPDFLSGRPIIGGKLDYIAFHPYGGALGIEIKNTREWIYPDKGLVKELLGKCVQIDVVPVLIARRIHYTTFSVLNACGGIVHQFYNQLYPNAEAELAARVRDKMALGYFDVRVGNEPDKRLLHFFGSSLPNVAEQSRETWNEKKKLVGEYTAGRLNYVQFYRKLMGNFAEDDATQTQHLDLP